MAGLATEVSHPIMPILNAQQLELSHVKDGGDFRKQNSLTDSVSSS